MKPIETVLIEDRLLEDCDSHEQLKKIVQHKDLSTAKFFLIDQGNVHSIKSVESLDKIAKKYQKRSPNNKRKLEGKALYKALGFSDSYKSLSERIKVGKRFLYLACRSGSFLDIFEPPRGVTCYRFNKLVLGTQCPYDCSYCYLQLTYRITPYTRIYLNLKKLFREIRILAESTNKTLVLNAGELSDPLALDHIVQVVPLVIQEVLKYPNIELLLLTKSSNIHHLPDLTNLPKRIIISASLTTPRNQLLFENGTASIEERIEALKKAQEKGYRVRARIDPIINSVPGWEKQYEDGLIKKLANRIVPESITLGQPRFYAPLLHLCASRFPEQKDFWNHLSTKTKDHRFRVSYEERFNTYEQIIDLLNSYFKPAQLTISLCKEDPGLASALGVPFTRKCNCLPLPDGC